MWQLTINPLFKGYKGNSWQGKLFIPSSLFKTCCVPFACTCCLPLNSVVLGVVVVYLCSRCWCWLWFLCMLVKKPFLHHYFNDKCKVVHVFISMHFTFPFRHLDLRVNPPFPVRDQMCIHIMGPIYLFLLVCLHHWNDNFVIEVIKFLSIYALNKCRESNIVRWLQLSHIPLFCTHINIRACNVVQHLICPNLVYLFLFF